MKGKNEKVVTFWNAGYTLNKIGITIPACREAIAHCLCTVPPWDLEVHNTNEMLAQSHAQTIPMRKRRLPAPARTGPLTAARGSARPAATRWVTVGRAIFALAPLLLLASALRQLASRATILEPAEYALPLPSSDDELAVSAYRIHAGDASSPDALRAAAAEPTTCMPSVTRSNGSVEYVSNAVKSWYLAHSRAPPPLIVFDMDAKPGGRAWRNAVGAISGSWLTTLHLEVPFRTPRKRTLTDSVQRVRWRSKEARDYAAVLRECAWRAVEQGAESDALVLIVQDDVLFRPDAARARTWADGAMRLGARSRKSRTGQVLPQRVCSASLFDMGGVGNDVLVSSNLVARYWRVGEAKAAAEYFERHFDDAPIDWLADDWCKKKHAVVAVMRPNPLRHRGRVSSFAENKRDNLLT